MIIYRCVNPDCPRHGQRTELICQAREPRKEGYGLMAGQPGVFVCLRRAEKDYT